MSALELRGAVVRLDGRIVLDRVDLGVAPGEIVALVGPNGAGKSSVIRALLGLISLEAGEARLGDQPVSRLSSRARAERAAYLPQERRIAWNMAAVDIAALGAPFLSGADATRRAREALALVGATSLADRGVADMSGGERARVLLARALVCEAPALLADEPIAGLDPDAQLLVLDLLQQRARSGQAVLVSLHDLTLAARHADRVLVIDRGRIVADALPTKALSAERLRETFGIRGRWIDAPSGPLLDLDRRQG
ncbi:iron complex transport system ATP-binding protein [Brevundimonas variabilis]|uniref:Iron complex transport system ATP-binding protein n=1 Tax=Brevundimonas variabilis TaxID=74312 RepID=A0A7W9CHS0_9CAUL|nr:iron complex transport system ATP-binding protein [Brevundimonas variabilis]